MTKATLLRRSTPLELLLITACTLIGASSATAQAPGTKPGLGAPPPAAPAAQPAAAQPAPAPAAPTAPAAEPTPAQREAAREAYARGQALFAQGNYAQAKAAFDQAYAAVPNPLVLLSTAECDVRLGNLEGAYAVLQQYLSDRPDAPDRAEVERKASELLAIPAQLVLTSDPAGAAIAIDGKETGRVTPADLELMHGEHRITLTLAGFEIAQETLTARIGARHEVQVKLHEAPPPPASDLKLSTEGGKPTTALWITSIVGAAGLVTGTVLGFMTLAERSDYDANPTKASADRGERLALFTDVAFGVGAMAVVTAAVLYLTGDEASVESVAPGTAALQLELTPSASAHGAGLSAHGRF